MAIIDDIEKIINSYGAKLYDSEVVSENGQAIYRVYIVKDGGVDLDLCANISKDASPLLDINPPIRGDYRFEISSPGIERKLTKPQHFKNSIGEKIKVKILSNGKNRGKLLSADNEGIELETKDEVATYKYSELGTVKTYFEW